MTLDPQLVAQLRQVCAHAASSATVNIYGETQVGSTATLYCRLESRTRTVERNDGTFVKLHGPLLIINAGTITPTYGSRFWIPGDSPSTASLARRPAAIEPCVDENGALEHWEVELV